jgi:hypothetical protein
MIYRLHKQNNKEKGFSSLVRFHFILIFIKMKRKKSTNAIAIFLLLLISGVFFFNSENTCIIEIYFCELCEGKMEHRGQ